MSTLVGSSAALITVLENSGGRCQTALRGKLMNPRQRHHPVETWLIVGTIFKSWARAKFILWTPIEPDRSISRIEVFMKQVARMIEAFSACCAFLLVCGAPAIYAQSCDVKISITALASPLAVIEGTQRAAGTNWSFRNSYAGVIGMGERISSLSLSDANGGNVKVLKGASGEFRAERAAVRYRYEVNLSPPAAATTASHLSWRTSDNGVLMLGDLLPLTCHLTARVRLVLPENWKIISAETKSGDAEYTVADTEQAVFYISRELREQRARINGTDFILGISGTWAFSDKEALSLMRDIINEHVRTTGSALKGRALIVLTPFPSVVGPFAWSAETRGRTVFLMSGQVPSKTAALAHLSVPLAHELFHLWVPNGLSLSGDYDWFYEGWTLYQAMRVGMQLGYLNFQDYLDALGRAFNGYRAVKDVASLSLLDLSKRRWTSGQALVYNKGMLTAFLFDLASRQRAGGGHNINSVYRELFNRYDSKKASADGNHAIREVLNRVLGSSTFTHAYIETAADIDLSIALRPFGLEVKEAGARVRVYVTKSLTKQQHHLLRGFGYNVNVGSATRGGRIGQSVR